MSLPSAADAIACVASNTSPVTHQELVEALQSLVLATYHDQTSTPATYWILGENGSRLNTKPFMQAEVDRLRAALPDSACASPRPVPVRIEHWAEEGGKLGNITVARLDG